MVKAFLDGNPVLRLYTYHDTTMPCSPNRRRPDFVWVLHDRIIIVEVDEHAHRHYNRECEIARVTELMEQCGALPLFLIRFNPKETLFPELHKVLLNCFTCPVPGLLDVHFLGYKQEYDVVKEIEMLAIKRRA